MTAFIEAQTQRDLSHAYPTASSIWPHPVASGCIPRKRLRGARAPLSWCFVMWQVVDSNHRRRSRRFYSPLAPPESPPADQRVRRSRRDCGVPPSAMRPWAPGSGGSTAHGRRRNWPRTRAKRPTDAGGKATDGPAGAVMLTAPARIPALTCHFRMPARCRRRPRHRGLARRRRCRGRRRCAGWRRWPARRCSGRRS